MGGLFESTEINKMILANRFMRSATYEGMATEDGSVTPELTEKMVELAKGGVGLIISGHAYILPEGQAGPRQLGIYKDEQIEGLKAMTDAVHEAGGKIVVQSAHAGAQADKELIKQPPHVASNFDGLATTPRHELTEEDIQKLVSAFADAAQRAKTAGFDGIQLHSAHGYFLNQFLSPFYNRRTDAYGGSVENRARIHLEVCQAIRSVVGDDYPLLIKINTEDFIDNGLSMDDSIQVSRMLADAGIDAIEISGGSKYSGKYIPSRIGINTEEKEAYFKDAAVAFKKAVDVPLILVGGIRSLTIAEQLLESGIADYISMCRPLIREPDLVNRWRSGDIRPATCKSDNLCFEPPRKGEGLYCVVDRRETT